MNVFRATLPLLEDRRWVSLTEQSIARPHLDLVALVFGQLVSKRMQIDESVRQNLSQQDGIFHEGFAVSMRRIPF
jgi:hypothetical protein